MSSPPVAVQQPPARLESLDAFRGFTIAAMLLVNNKGSDAAFPHQFHHAEWGEFVTFCDMIFPWFLFIVGVALPWSTASHFRKGGTMASFAAKCARRAAMLVLLGILIDCSVMKRIHVGMNVLQLIGLAFFCGAMASRLAPAARNVLAGLLLAAYAALLLFVPIPGVGAGFFEADRNIVGWINGHLRPWHLAGILSVIPATALVLIGVAVGDVIRDSRLDAMRRLGRMAAIGIALALGGLGLHVVLPMNKPVWTPSYILFAGGLGAVLLAGFHAVMDIGGWRAWAFPFVVYGMNAIAAYFVSIMVRLHTVQEWTMDAGGQAVTIWQAMIDGWMRVAGDTAGPWLFTGSYLLFWFAVLWMMHRRGIFWKA